MRRPFLLVLAPISLSLSLASPALAATISSPSDAIAPFGAAVAQQYSTFTVQPTDVATNAPATFTISLRDAKNLPIANRPLAFLVNINSVTSTQLAATNRSGVASVVFQSQQPGMIALSITLDGVPFNASASVTAPAVAEPVPVVAPPVDPTVVAAPAPQPEPIVSSGRFVWNPSSNILTYQDPTSHQTLKMWDAAWAFGALSKLATPVSAKVLNSIPLANQKANTNGKKYAGRLLATASDKKHVWYIDPMTFKRNYFDGTQASFAYLQTLAEQGN
jgi:hypothetical protein